MRSDGIRGKHSVSKQIATKGYQKLRQLILLQIAKRVYYKLQQLTLLQIATRGYYKLRHVRYHKL